MQLGICMFSKCESKFRKPQHVCFFYCLAPNASFSLARTNCTGTPLCDHLLFVFAKARVFGAVEFFAKQPFVAQLHVLVARPARVLVFAVCVQESLAEKVSMLRLQ
jgi:hypothetical protein